MLLELSDSIAFTYIGRFQVNDEENQRFDVKVGYLIDPSLIPLDHSFFLPFIAFASSLSSSTISLRFLVQPENLPVRRKTAFVFRVPFSASPEEADFGLLILTVWIQIFIVPAFSGDFLYLLTKTEAYRERLRNEMNEVILRLTQNDSVRIMFPTLVATLRTTHLLIIVSSMVIYDRNSNLFSPWDCSSLLEFKL
ncbi:hypothetical protein ACSQ67_003619 [Phaseolus vulgaris]